MHYRSFVAVVTLVPFRPHHIHHLRVAYAHHLIAHLGTNALACNLFHI